MPLLVGRRSENSFQVFRQNDGPKTDIAFNPFLKIFDVEVRGPTQENYIKPETNGNQLRVFMNGTRKISNVSFRLSFFTETVVNNHSRKISSLLTSIPTQRVLFRSNFLLLQKLMVLRL